MTRYEMVWHALRRCVTLAKSERYSMVKKKAIYCMYQSGLCQMSSLWFESLISRKYHSLIMINDRFDYWPQIKYLIIVGLRYRYVVDKFALFGSSKLFNQDTFHEICSLGGIRSTELHDRSRLKRTWSISAIKSKQKRPVRESYRSVIYFSHTNHFKR